MKFADLWRPRGTVNRATYALVGAIGFALKHNLDRIVATVGFHRPWSVFNYWAPLKSAGRITELSRSDDVFLATMVMLALPFIWVGVTMTLKRLRAASLPLQLVVLFFVPFLNLLFFLILCVVPERISSKAATDAGHSSFLQRVVPKSAWGSAAFSLIFTVPLGICLVWLGTTVLQNYGWGLFIVVPFGIGLFAALVYGVNQPRSHGSCIAVACVSMLILGISLLAIALEGVVCLVMAAPLALPLAAFGGSCGYFVQKQRWQREYPVVACAIFLLLPGTQWFEHELAPASPTYVVRSAIDIQAPPEKVWKYVVAFSEIPPPTEMLFRAGIAYPIRAQIFGTGAGAERHCVFSTGAFVEPIQIWDEPRQLKFSVTANPPPMQEWTPYSHIDTPHLHGFLVSNGGQFLLTPLPNGGTRLEGTTWYRHGLWPAAYWRVWSDVIIHRIHMRVLRHIQQEAENDASSKNYQLTRPIASNREVNPID